MPLLSIFKLSFACSPGNIERRTFQPVLVDTMLKKKYPEIFADSAVNGHSIFSGLKPDAFFEIEHFFEDILIRKGSTLLIDSDNPVFVIVVNGSLTCTEHLHKAGTSETSDLSIGSSAGSVSILKPDFSKIELKANEPVKLLALSKKSFQDMSEQVSRSCNLVYLNLCNILSERIEALTGRYTTLFAEKQNEGKD